MGIIPKIIISIKVYKVKIFLFMYHCTSPDSKNSRMYFEETLGEKRQ